MDVLGSTDSQTLFWCWFWGVMWGLGGLTFGLTMRYLGLSLGMAVALGSDHRHRHHWAASVSRAHCGELAATPSGRITFIGIGITLVGIVARRDGRREQRRARGCGAGKGSSGMAEFDLRKGLLIAVFSGCLSGMLRVGPGRGSTHPDGRVGSRRQPACGRGCRCCVSCWRVASPPTSSGARC